MEKLSWIENRNKFTAPLAPAQTKPPCDLFLAATGAFDTSNNDVPILSKTDDDNGDVPDVVGNLIKAMQLGTETAAAPLAKRAPGAPMSLFFRVNKIDEERRMVFGCAAAEEPDRQNEILDYEGSKPYFKSWSESVRKDSQGKSAGNVREMHTLSAVGALEQIQFDDAAKKIEVAAKIIDDDAWRKCVAGVYCGFSIGGKYAKSWQDGKLTRYIADPSEVSIVDRPAIPSATFELLKADGRIEICKFTNDGGNMTEKDFHKTYYAHHEQKAQIHAGHAEAHKSMMDVHEKGTPEHAYHETKHGLHKKANESHATVAAYHKACMEKAAGDELNKVADGLTPAVLENALRGMFLKMFGDVVVPSRISAIAPPRMIPRAGAPTNPEAPPVAPEFQKLFSTGDREEPLRQ